jgi:hypothetical protein
MEQNNFAAWQVQRRKTQPQTPLLKKSTRTCTATPKIKAMAGYE